MAPIRNIADLEALGAQPYTPGAPALGSLIGLTLGPTGPANVDTVVLYANDAQEDVTLRGARVWAIGALSPGGADYMDLHLATWPTLDVSSPVGAVLVGTLSTRVVGFVEGVPRTFVLVTPGKITIPAGGCLAFRIDATGAGQTLPPLVLRTY